MPSLEVFDLAPIAKQRPRWGQSQVAYTPKASLQFEKKLRDRWIEEHPDWADTILDGPVRVDLTFAPKHIYVNVTPIIAVVSKLRGDLDNYAKSVLDALNGIAYSDDKQIHILSVNK